MFTLVCECLGIFLLFFFLYEKEGIISRKANCFNDFLLPNKHARLIDQNQAIGTSQIQQTYFLPTEDGWEWGDALFCVKPIDRFPGVAAAAECNFLAGLIRPPGR